jgi:16S rRNA (guanine527-N7)-methyltransferase
MFHVEHRGTSDDRNDRFAEVLVAGAAELGLDLSNALITQFSLYLRELKAWNQKTNLTAITDDDEIAVKHFLDSLVCSRAVAHPEVSRLLDVGSGAGFPGLPLKLLDPSLDVTLLEPSQKKTAFLRHLIGTFKLEGIVAIPQRVEEFSRQPSSLARFTHVITRAVNVTDLLGYFIPLLQPQGQVILCRAKPLDSDIKLEGLQMRQEIAYTLPLGQGQRVLSILTLSQ